MKNRRWTPSAKQLIVLLVVAVALVSAFALSSARRESASEHEAAQAVEEWQRDMKKVEQKAAADTREYNDHRGWR